MPTDTRSAVEIAHLRELREQRRTRMEKRIIGVLACALILLAAKASGRI